MTFSKMTWVVVMLLCLFVGAPTIMASEKEVILGHEILFSELMFEENINGFKLVLKDLIPASDRTESIIEAVYSTENNLQFNLQIFLPSYHSAKIDYAVDRFWLNSKINEGAGLRFQKKVSSKDFEIFAFYQTEDILSSASYGKVVGNYAMLVSAGLVVSKGNYANDWARCREAAEKIGERIIALLQDSILSEAALPKSLEEIQEFRDFRGLDDRRVGPDIWKDWLDACSRKFVTTVKEFPDVKGNITIPNETQEDIQDGVVDGFLKEKSGKEPGQLAKILAMDDLPAERRDNVYGAVTAATEEPLRQKILAGKDDMLLPADVVKMALEVCDGSYPLAVLTAHSVLKYAAKKGRDDGQNPMFIRGRNGHWKQAYQLRKKLRPYSEIAIKLRNLRPAGDFTGDKLGPWYHIFGLLSAGALVNSLEANIGARGEHWMKFMGSFGKAEGAFNKEKETIDYAFAGATEFLREFNRFYEKATADQLKDLQIKGRK